jgi:hypothetical protein
MQSVALGVAASGRRRERVSQLAGHPKGQHRGDESSNLERLESISDTRRFLWKSQVNASALLLHLQMEMHKRREK